MPWRGAEVAGEFPTLGYQVADLIEAKCAIPDGPHAGQPFLLTDEQLRFLLWLYRLNPGARRDPRTGLWPNAFYFARGAQLTRPQKWGKGPFVCGVICAEADPEGPVLFDGWDANGDPVGKPWPTPWIQVAAISEAQTDNIWSALLPMIEMGAMSADIPDTGVTKIYLPHGGKIEPVTSSANSRLGQRITLGVQDEVQDWTETNGGRKVADTQRRNLSGMGGRFIATGNAWDPAENSVAQTTFDDREPGVYFDDVEPGPGSIRNKTERRRMLTKVYGDSWWVDLDRIELEIEALLKRDPAQAERFFLNRKQAAEGAAFDHERFADELFREFEPPRRDVITIGVDGARFVDAIAAVATHVLSGYQWPLKIIERPKAAPEDYEHSFEAFDGALLEAFEQWRVWRMYVDPQHIDGWLEKWQGRWGRKRVLPWYTSRQKQIAWAVRNYTDALGAGEVGHNGDPDFVAHVRHARKEKLNVFDDKHRQMHTLAKDRSDSPRKIDAAMAAVISWEARGDCISEGRTKPRGRQAVFI